ncbi:transglycosylase SLT domain-containing protein [Tabrizicola thermarum]|uniref:transglycosylase SLT domain-containing protein n=1 Tax=Tabrizicola thermarum TaxID=2670345 RepID=UPI000FFBDB03|nr:transglycosylase SLT domain-containing protein [Tabrizicola thermarum]
MAFGNRYPTFGVLFASSYLLATLPGYSLGDPAALCREAAAHAAAKTGVPYDVLIAIATVETGRNNQPWPWTVNFAGEGHWYDSAADAALSVQQALSTGATNIDIGCFQLNYRWHARAFTSVEDMLDPARNAIYAAEFLSRHYANTGDWALAAAAYHSGTPEYARAYQSKFEETYDRLGALPAPAEPSVEKRRNGFPLLVAGAAGQNGSLFSSTSGGRPLIGTP